MNFQKESAMFLRGSCGWMVAFVFASVSMPSLAQANERFNAHAFVDENSGEGARIAQRGQGGNHKSGKRRGKMSPEMREKMKKKLQRKMQTYLTVELSSLLELDDKQTLRLGAALKKNGALIEGHHRQMRSASDALEQALASSAAEETIRKRLGELTSLTASRPGPELLLSETKSFLTVRQQAKMVLALPPLMKEMRSMVKRTRKDMKRERRRHRGPPNRE